MDNKDEDFVSLLLVWYKRQLEKKAKTKIGADIE